MSIIHISKDAYPELIDALREEGHQMALQGPKQAVSQGIDCHPDIYMVKLGTSPESPVFQGDAGILGPDYPADVPYNAVVTEKYLICNTKTVSPDVVKAANALYPDIITVHVAQGYTKCSLVVVDECHFITEDEGIYRELGKTDGIECLLISSGYVLLPGYDSGFIGGASGRIGDEVWFNGDLTLHPDCDRITEFICNCGLTVSWISGKPLLDIGSIIEEAI